MATDNPLRETFNEKGESISPVLAEGVKNFLVDIDGTVCDDVPNEEPERMSTVLPYPDALQMVNQWYEEGHIITFFTSRTSDTREVTIEWLDRHGFKYHDLLMDKPRGGNYHWIDNHIVKATRYKGRFTDLIVETKEIEVFRK
ncbi:MAG: phosphoheptose isomerase [Saprospiraceae bacterium]